MKYAKLRGAIRERFGTQRAFAKAMSLSLSALNQKLCGRVGWSIKDVETAIGLLDIPAEEIPAYFFTS